MAGATNPASRAHRPAAEQLIVQWKGDNPAKTDGHMIGAFYMQAACPWLCTCKLHGIGAQLRTDK